jgi:hypothetical protein
MVLLGLLVLQVLLVQVKLVVLAQVDPLHPLFLAPLATATLVPMVHTATAMDLFLNLTPHPTIPTQYDPFYLFSFFPLAFIVETPSCLNHLISMRNRHLIAFFYSI